MDKKEALKIVQEDDWQLKDLPAHFRKDKKFILEAVKLNGHALEYADDSLKKDKEVVLEALKKSGTLKDRDGKTILISLEDIDESLRNDPDILAIVNKKK